MSRHDQIEMLMGMIDDDIICEYMSSAIEKRRPVRSVRMAIIAAVCAVILAVPLTIGIMNRGEDPVPPVGETTYSTEVTPPVTEDVTPETDVAPPDVSGKFSVLSISASKVDAHGFIAGDTSFIVKTQNGSVNQVRKNVYIEPALEYTVRESGEETFEIVPSEVIPDNTVVKLSEVEDKIIINSWAFQTREVLSVSGTYPANGTMHNSVNTVVEIEFSYAAVENLTDHVTIEPAIRGVWEHFGKTWRFTPSAPLAEESEYTVTVSPGITAEDQVIEESFTFRFGTYAKTAEQVVKLTPQVATVDNINTYLPGEEISMMLTANANAGEESFIVTEETVYNVISGITLEKFDSPEEFINASSGENAYHSTVIGEYGYQAAVMQEVGFTYPQVLRLTLDTTLDTGYYRAVLHNEEGEFYAEWFIQVHPLSVYAMTAAHELLIWAAEGDNFAADVPVSLLGTEYKTDGDGILSIDISEMPSLEGKYMYIGGGEVPLIVGTDEISTTYPKGYMYADKLKYRTNDTINIWGYVPIDIIPKTSEGEFRVKIGDFKEIPVTLDENGTFSVSYEISDFAATQLSLGLYLDDRSICAKSVEVADYENVNYTYEIILEKNHLTLGDTFEFDVAVTHLSGITAAGKELTAECFNKRINGVTDENGIAHFEVSTEDYIEKRTYLDYERTSIDDFAIDIYSSGEDEYSHQAVASYQWCYIILKPEVITHSWNEDKLTFNVNETRPAEKDMIESDEELYGDPTEAELQVTVYEYHHFRYISEYVYDPFLKENVPHYKYKSEDTVIDTFTADTKNGAFVLDFSEYELKEDTDIDTYRYYATVNSVTEKDIPMYYQSNYSSNISDEGNSAYYDIYRFEGAIGQHNIQLRMHELDHYRGVTDAYTSYKYAFLSEELPTIMNQKGVGDELKLTLAGYGDAPTDSGKVMRIILQNETVRTDLLDPTADPSFILEEDMLPSITVTGVYYRDGVFYRMPRFSVNLGVKNRDIELSAESDREVYSPGDTVTLDITATDVNGNPVAGSSVNISVMDSAVGDLPGYNSISSVKTGYLYDCYSFSSYRDYNIYSIVGGYGDGGGYPVRTTFLDSPYFGSTVTDENGKATVTFTLPDNITEYSITVHAANSDWYTGSTRSTIKVSKDLFIQHIVPNDVKSTDDFVINSVCNGNSIRDISATISVKETGQSFELNTVTGRSFEANFGKLPAGTYTVTVTAQAGEFYDAVEYPVTVVDSAQEFEISERIELDEEIVIKPVSNPVEIQITTESYDRYMEYLSFVWTHREDRADAQLAYYEGTKLREALLNNYISTESFSYYYLYDDSEGLLKPLENAEGDPVLTALVIWLSEDYRSRYDVQDTLSELGTSAPKSLTDAAEKLFLRAVCGHPVLKDLRYMARSIEDDDYIEMILALGFIASGDYDSARELYLDSASDPGNDGYMALRAIAAAFVDKDNAAEMIDSMIANDPSEYYLGLALVAYMQNRCGLTETEQSVTVTCGDFMEEVTVVGLESKTVTVVTEELEDIVIVPHSDEVCASYSCVVGLDQATGAEKAIGAVLAEKTEGGEKMMHLTFDFSRLDEAEGTLYVVLPDSLEIASLDNISHGYGVRVNLNRLEITKRSRSDCEKFTSSTPYSSTVTLKLLAKSDGNFEFESAVFVEDDGTVYLSDGFMFDLNR